MAEDNNKEPSVEEEKAPENERDKKPKKEKEELDTQTSFADMNVEGFSWYDPHKKQNKERKRVSRKEYWRMVRGAFAAYLPVFGMIVCVGAIIYLLARIWLG